MGLDVSTSCIGVAVIDDTCKVILLDRIEFKGCVTLWEKADHARDEFNKLKEKFKIDKLFVEDAALRFTPGRSSMQTIATLLRFNGLISYFAREIFGIEPGFVSASHARKLCGMKMQRVSVCGKSHKEQVWDHMSMHDLKDHPWPTKFNKKKKVDEIVGWSRDACDAFVIAKAGLLE